MPPSSIDAFLRSRGPFDVYENKEEIDKHLGWFQIRTSGYRVGKLSVQWGPTHVSMKQYYEITRGWTIREDIEAFVLSNEKGDLDRYYPVEVLELGDRH